MTSKLEILDTLAEVLNYVDVRDTATPTEVIKALRKTVLHIAQNEQQHASLEQSGNKEIEEELNKDELIPREYTVDEVRELFLDQVRANTNYWLNAARKGEVTWERAVTGSVFSTLVILDGESELPGFVVAPAPHPDDQRYHKEHSRNWFPEVKQEVACDIAGSLHNQFYKMNSLEEEPSV